MTPEPTPGPGPGPGPGPDRAPGLSAADWPRLSALFDELAALPPEARADRLATVQPPALAERLQRMLASLPADDAATARLDLPGFKSPLSRALGAPPAAPAPPQPGDRFGPWRLEALLGEGGMGQVWRARRADGLYDGEAAIKLLRGDLASAGLAARFARERNLLGRLTHPGIARLLDAGEQDGRAYLVLEYVPGQTLADYTREHDLTLDARVRLMVQVARAVEHAHAQLIVHRDLKPSNVMVDAHGGTKLLDFGIAGLLDDSGQQADHQLTLLAGRRLTPAYAAPEQITGDTMGVASDIYSLGVMLYELASGELPFGTRSGSRTALEHAVLHGEAKRISRTVRTEDTDAPLTGTGGPAARASGPGRPLDAARARGDLEAVAAKALRRAPAERYASVGGFIDDLERWLTQRPVSVRAEDWRHRVHLWVRRNAVVAAAGTLVFVALSAGLAVSLWQREQAQLAARQSEEVTQYLTELLASASPEKHGGHIPSIFEVLETSRGTLRERFAHDDLTYARVLEVMAATYDEMNRQDISIPLAREFVEARRRLWGDDDLRTLRAQLRLARTYTALGSPMEVIAIGEQVLPRLDPAAAPGDYENLLYQLLVAYGNVGRFAEAEAMREKAWALVQERYQPSDYEYQFFRMYVFTLRHNQERWHDAEAELLPLVAAGQHADVKFARFAHRAEQMLWVVQTRLGQPGITAEQALERADAMDALLGPGNSSSQRQLNDLTRMLLDRGDYRRAAEVQALLARRLPESAALNLALRLPREAVALLADTLAHPQHPADLRARAKRLSDELLSGQLPAGPPWAEAVATTARAALALNDLGLAARLLAPLQAMQGQGWMAGYASWRTRVGQMSAELDRARGDAARGLPALRERLAHLDGLPPPQGVLHWRAQLSLAASLVATQAPDAHQALARADALRPDWLPPGHPMDALRAALGRGSSSAPWAGQF
ncbi:serine/threonine-protein kinase [Roseateles sp. BYS87W]|uniref:Protein kinase n=1 Tax=Pelomonas baiyunensis TaxID=3299026 RepID=A0ABW7H1N9_9BURK